MTSSDCNFANLKLALKEQLDHIHGELGQIIANLDQGDACLLNEIDRISRTFTETGTVASTYYLNCFLSPYTNKYTEISATLHRLSAKRQGALIVIQRKKPIDDWITPGIRLAAELTGSLLESIFVPGSPLHDGAVCIRADRIVSAANILPLTDRAFPHQKMGTRHRAAIGLSERTDALILVVSEETGRTSFCLNGNLYPCSVSG